jgi:hypothetical protein
MEMPQKTLYIAILNKNTIFFPYKNREQGGKTGTFWEVGASGRVEDIKKG